MKTTTIEKVKQGEYFMFIGTAHKPAKKIYVSQGYNRYEKKYWYVSVDDVLGAGYGKKKGTKVIIDFDY